MPLGGGIHRISSLLIENYFGKLKENRGRAMRSCKTDQSFKAFIPIAATIIQTRLTSTAPRCHIPMAGLFLTAGVVVQMDQI